MGWTFSIHHIYVEFVVVEVNHRAAIWWILEDDSTTYKANLTWLQAAHEIQSLLSSGTQNKNTTMTAYRKTKMIMSYWSSGQIWTMRLIGEPCLHEEGVSGSLWPGWKIILRLIYFLVGLDRIWKKRKGIPMWVCTL